MTTWYRTTTYTHGIEPFEITKETPQYLFYYGERRGGTREIKTPKKTSMETWFPSYKEALDHLIDRVEADRQKAIQLVFRAEAVLEKLRAMKEPEGEKTE